MSFDTQTESGVISGRRVAGIREFLNERLGVSALGRISVNATPSQPARVYSLSQELMGMLGSDSGYVYSFDLEASPPGEEVIGAVQDFLKGMGNPDLTLSRLREFEFAYQAEIVEMSSGRHAFHLMFGKATWRIPPEAGPNVFWNTKYDSMIAEVGGGYGMLGRLIPSFDPSQIMSISEPETFARERASDLPGGLVQHHQRGTHPQRAGRCGAAEEGARCVGAPGDRPVGIRSQRHHEHSGAREGDPQRPGARRPDRRPGSGCDHHRHQGRPHTDPQPLLDRRMGMPAGRKCWRLSGRRRASPSSACPMGSWPSTAPSN